VIIRTSPLERSAAVQRARAEPRGRRTARIRCRRVRRARSIAGGIVEQDLPAARPADDVVAEAHPGRAQPLDLGELAARLRAWPTRRYDFDTVIRHFRVVGL